MPFSISSGPAYTDLRSRTCRLERVRPIGDQLRDADLHGLFEFDDLDTNNDSRPLITLRKSKTDQEAIGVKIPISRELYDLILLWRRTADISGSILRAVDRHGNVGRALNSSSIGTILNHLASSGPTASQCISYSGHSFRVGRAVDLLNEGIPLEKIMLIGGWRSQSACISYLRSQQYYCDRQLTRTFQV